MVAVSGCSSRVSVDPPDPPVEAAACGDLMAGLPSTLLGEPSRTTEPDSPLTAAWGDPAITVRCGVPDPAALTPTSQLISIDGVDWLPEPLDDGYRFTSQGRITNVEVTVPDAYSPEADPVTVLSPLVKDSVPAG